VGGVDSRRHRPDERKESSLSNAVYTTAGKRWPAKIWEWEGQMTMLHGNCESNIINVGSRGPEQLYHETKYNETFEHQHLSKRMTCCTSEAENQEDEPREDPRNVRGLSEITQEPNSEKSKGII
jgi:hypothetical protein